MGSVGGLVVVVVVAVGVVVGGAVVVVVWICGWVGLGWGVGGEGGVPEDVGLERGGCLLLVDSTQRGGGDCTEGGWRTGSEESIVGCCWRDGVCVGDLGDWSE